MVYLITNYTKNKAKQYGVTVQPSTMSGKKIDVYRDGEIIARIGALGYSDYSTYIITHGLQFANERRKLYRIRHEKDRSKMNSNGYWADRLLW
jgi:hypothetical protein